VLKSCFHQPHQQSFEQSKLALSTPVNPFTLCMAMKGSGCSSGAAGSAAGAADEPALVLLFALCWLLRLLFLLVML
jgi:hypothetical protein